MGRMVGFKDEMSEFPLRNEDIRIPPMSSMARCPQYQGDRHSFGDGGPRLIGDTCQHEHQVGGRPSEEYGSGHMPTNSVPCNGQQSSFGSFQTATEESLLQGFFESGRFKTYELEKYDGTSIIVLSGRFRSRTKSKDYIFSGIWLCIASTCHQSIH